MAATELLLPPPNIGPLDADVCCPLNKDGCGCPVVKEEDTALPPPNKEGALLPPNVLCWPPPKIDPEGFTFAVWRVRDGDPPNTELCGVVAPPNIDVCCFSGVPATTVDADDPPNMEA